ncbi:MAG: extracellular solute-binding protein [Oscillospiraceae bacterium]|nr:extracellular solute-binding protein [Oscillospiraceae bacterium]
MKKIKRHQSIFNLVLALILAASLLVACGQGQAPAAATTAGSNATTAAAAAATTAAAAAAAEATTAAAAAATTAAAVASPATTAAAGAAGDAAGQTAAEPGAFPLFDTVTEFTMYHPLNAKATASLKDYSEMWMFSELERMTNVKIVFQHPAVGQETEAFNLMLASGDYPDIINGGSWGSGGAAKGLADNVIMPLNDLLAEHGPYLNALMDEFPDIRRYISTDEGILFSFPNIKIRQTMKSVWGQMVRKDWLDDLGLDIPKSFDEYHDMLVAFKDADLDNTGQTIYPYTSWTGYSYAMFHPWGINVDHANIDGVYVYSPYSEQYRDAIETWSLWYSEGLVDPDYSTNNQRLYEDRITSGISGASFGEAGGSTGLMNNYFDENGFPERKFVGIPTFTKDGSPGYNFNGDPMGAAVIYLTTACKYPVELTKYFDWAYSDEGQIMYCFGQEGESYNLVDGEPVLSDYVMNNPDGLTIDQALARFCYGSMTPSSVQLASVREQRMLFFDWQRESVENWNKDINYVRIMPPVTRTPAESERYSDLLADIGTYVEESRLSFINGTRPLSDYDSYLAQLKDMGVEEVIAIQQAALDRFLAR